MYRMIVGVLNVERYFNGGHHSEEHLLFAAVDDGPDASGDVAVLLEAARREYPEDMGYRDHHFALHGRAPTTLSDRYGSETVYFSGYGQYSDNDD